MHENYARLNHAQLKLFSLPPPRPPHPSPMAEWQNVLTREEGNMTHREVDEVLCLRFFCSWFLKEGDLGKSSTHIREMRRNSKQPTLNYSHGLLRFWTRFHNLSVIIVSATGVTIESFIICDECCDGLSSLNYTNPPPISTLRTPDQHNVTSCLTGRSYLFHMGASQARDNRLRRYAVYFALPFLLPSSINITFNPAATRQQKKIHAGYITQSSILLPDTEAKLFQV